ncbi:hypothetical protein Taro_010268, partial [Colocasia esculenta]|nr:hypothetical protein [Colocasia esculenta]
PVSTQTWSRGHGRRGPSRGLTDRRLESGQRWNVKVIGGTGIGESGAQFISHMGIVSKLHCKIWQKYFVKLPADIIDTIFRDLENITDRNKRHAHDREHNRVEIFKDGRCKELPDGNEQWVDDESRSRYERMIQLSTPSVDSESGSTPISTEEAFVSVIGKDQFGRIRCEGSRKTCRTWYGTGEGSSSTDYQQQISNIENTLRMEVEELRIEVRRRDSEMDEMRRELEQLRKRESEIDDIRR